MEPKPPTADFVPPGPGCWEHDPVHVPRPVTPWVAEILPRPSTEGFSISAGRYGLLIDGLRFEVVNGFWFHQVVPFGQPGAGPDHPEFARRFEITRDAFERRTWREHLRTWDEVLAPRARALREHLQRVDPNALPDSELRSHLADCRDALAEAWRRHHEYSVTALLPVGDYGAHAREWTGLSLGELLQPLRGSSPLSLGTYSGELETLGAALRADARFVSEIQQLPAASAVERLRTDEGAVGRAARAWLDEVGWRSLGYDVCDPVALELPEVLVQACLAEWRQDAIAEKRAAADAEAGVRAKVPAEHRELFDELLAEARLINRLRDERGLRWDSWATGLSRRALLAVGTRLHARRVLATPELALDATPAELHALLSGTAVVDAATLAERRHHRSSREPSDAPPWLGEPPSPPPPPDGLPPHVARAARAVGCLLEGVFGEAPPAPASGNSFEGLPVSPGTYDGPARIVLGPADFARLQSGDVLVTRATAATFNVVLPLLGAIVTDRGGQLCHAAIVARESGIPAVVGTGIATSRLRDGQRVRVDGSRGVVTVLS